MASSAEIPFITRADGRQVLTDEQLQNEPHLADFVKRFPNSFERDPLFAGYIYIEPEKPRFNSPGYGGAWGRA